MRRATALLALLAAGCASTPAPVGPIAWRAVASEGDRERLRDWRSSFANALAAATAAGEGQRIAAEGPLLALDSALGGGIPSGRFQCRWIKFLHSGELRAFAPTPCALTPAGAARTFAFIGGAQRPAGTFYPEDRVRLAFLGALSLGDEPAVMRYGTDPDRDMAGWVERVGEARWRILLPRPRLDSRFDVIELTPAG